MDGGNGASSGERSTLVGSFGHLVADGRGVLGALGIATQVTSEALKRKWQKNTRSETVGIDNSGCPVDENNIST